MIHDSYANSLINRVEEVFQSAIKLTCNKNDLESLHQLIKQSYERLHQPMRVAIIGKIKAGKSTVINALLGEYLVSTGPEELTFNINWLKYGEKSDLKVYFKDDRPSESKSIEELDFLTRRREENRNFLRNIKFIEVFYPSSILKKFDLIDTPGLESFFDDDSRNTLDFLQIKFEELAASTQRELNNSDAVLYLFSQGIAVTDQAILDEIQGPAMGNATPINSIGVLTKVDSYWPEYAAPLEAGHKITQRLISDYPQIRSLFFAIYPVCGLLAIGAKTLSSLDIEILTQLASLPNTEFDKLIRTAERFNKKDYPHRADIPAAKLRSNLWRKLGKYGISLACDLLRSENIEQKNLADKLFQKSGVAELQDLILSHFGNRAFLIKLGTGLRQILIACDENMRRLEESERKIVEIIAGSFEALEAQEHSFKELKILCEFYKNKLQLNQQEIQQLLEITGEYGQESWARLGVSEQTGIEEKLKVAEERMIYWQQKMRDVMGLNRTTLNAAKVIARSYERLIYLVG